MSNKRNRQKWLLDKARDQQCTAMLTSVCNYDVTTTSAAHIQLQGLGKMGGKTFDLHTAWLCSACHDAIDGRVKTRYSKRELEAAAYEAVLRTQARLFDELTENERAKLGEATR